MMFTKKPKLYQYAEEIGKIRDQYNADKFSKYNRNNILSAHSQNAFNNCINMMKTDKDNVLKVLILYENIINCNVDNVEKLTEVANKLDIVAVCGNQLSLDYLWENKQFMSIFTDLYDN